MPRRSRRSCDGSAFRQRCGDHSYALACGRGADGSARRRRVRRGRTGGARARGEGRSDRARPGPRVSRYASPGGSSPHAPSIVSRACGAERNSRERDELPRLHGREPGGAGHHDAAGLQRRRRLSDVPDQHPEPPDADRRHDPAPLHRLGLERGDGRPRRARRRLRGRDSPEPGGPVCLGRHELHALRRRASASDAVLLILGRSDGAHQPLGARQHLGSSLLGSSLSPGSSSTPIGNPNFDAAGGTSRPTEPRPLLLPGHHRAGATADSPAASARADLRPLPRRDEAPCTHALHGELDQAQEARRAAVPDDEAPRLSPASSRSPAGRARSGPTSTRRPAATRTRTSSPASGIHGYHAGCTSPRRSARTCRR